MGHDHHRLLEIRHCIPCGREEILDGGSTVANLIGSLCPHHQTEEAGSTGDDTKESNEEAGTPGKEHPGMDPRGLLTTREAQTSRSQELAEKGLERPAKQTGQTQEAVEKIQVGKKPIKFSLQARLRTGRLRTKNPPGDHRRGG